MHRARTGSARLATKVVIPPVQQHALVLSSQFHNVIQFSRIVTAIVLDRPAPIHEGPWGSETSAKRLPRGCLNLAAALRPTLPLTPKGPSSGVDAPCGDFEDNKGLSGPTGKKHK